MGQSTNELREVLEKIIQELYDVRESISELRKEYLGSDEDIKSSKEFYREIINNLIRSNVELHAKVSELVVVINGLSKDLRELLNIFKEAALLYMEGKKTTEPKESKNIEKKIEEIENVNKKLLEVLDKLYSELIDIKKEKEKKEEKLIKRPLPPPPMPIYGPKKM